MNPLETVIKIHKKAKENNDPSADICFLSTVDSHDHPHVRTLELMDITKESIIILTNKQSPKRKQLNEKKLYELLLFYHTIPSQIRLKGDYKEMYEKTVKEYWNNKDYNIKILDIFHERYKEQSKTFISKEKFNERIEELKKEFPEDKIEMPENVTGYFLIPNKIEFWKKESPELLPERELYTFTGITWLRQYLVP